LRSETLSGVDKAVPSTWLAEQADQRRSHRCVGGPALGRELSQPHPHVYVRRVECPVRFATNRERDTLWVVLPALEHGNNVLGGARTDPKPVWFGIVDTSLCLDMSEGGDHLPRTFCGRSLFRELMELYEMYVVDRTYIDPVGRSWYLTA
jgi:hypothetical protein